MIYKIKNQILLIILAPILLSGCVKNTTGIPSEKESYIRAISAPGNQTVRAMKSTGDGGYLLIGTEDLFNSNDDNGLLIIKTDAAGNVLWRKNFPDSLPHACVTTLDDGGFLLEAAFYPARLCKIDKNGNVIFNNIIPSNSYQYYSFPIQTAAGDFLVASTNGQGSGMPSANWVDHCNASGKYLDYKIFSDSSFLGKVLYLNLYNFEDTSTYYFYGLKFDNPSWTWFDIMHMFVAKQTYAGKTLVSNQVKTLDPNNKTNTNIAFGEGFSNLFHMRTPDKCIVIVNVQIKNPIGFTGYIVKVDENLNILWERELNVSIKGTMPLNISLTPDGNYLVSGACKLKDKIPNQPFSCIYSPEGKLLSSNIYSTVLSGSFNTGMILNDGSMIFGGTSNGFGNGQNLNDIFLMKTDKNGNIK